MHFRDKRHPIQFQSSHDYDFQFLSSVLFYESIALQPYLYVGGGLRKLEIAMLQ